MGLLCWHDFAFVTPKAAMDRILPHVADSAGTANRRKGVWNQIRRASQAYEELTGEEVPSLDFEMRRPELAQGTNSKTAPGEEALSDVVQNTATGF
jgi:hypothetical protein